MFLITGPRGSRVQTAGRQFELLNVYLILAERPLAVSPGCTVHSLFNREVAVKESDETSIAFKSALAQLGVNTAVGVVFNILGGRSNARNN